MVEPYASLKDNVDTMAIWAFPGQSRSGIGFKQLTTQVWCLKMDALS